MAKQKVTHEFEEMEVEIEWNGAWMIAIVDFTVVAELSYQPAQLSGPPENCYPDESECDLESLVFTSVTDEEGNPMKITGELDKELNKKLDINFVEECLWADWEN